MAEAVLLAPLLLVTGLTAVVATRTAFSFLRSAPAMATIAGASVLCHTSGILRTYRTDQPLAAALALFASVALLFWYLLQIVAGNRR